MICTGKGCLSQKKMDKWWCPKCGKPTDPPGPRYSEAVLESFVDAAVKAGQVHRERGPLIASCTARLAQGAIEYGDLQFWHADCAKEAGEEGVDAINWAFLHYTKSLAGKGGTDPDEDGQDIAVIAACGASIFAAANRIRARRQEE